VSDRDTEIGELGERDGETWDTIQDNCILWEGRVDRDGYGRIGRALAGGDPEPTGVRGSGLTPAQRAESAEFQKRVAAWASVRERRLDEAFQARDWQTVEQLQDDPTGEAPEWAPVCEHGIREDEFCVKCPDGGA
jgi:hypothetical protein